MKLIGGEMPGWSDRRPGERPPAHGAALAHLVARVVPAGGRVLVAGPHDPALLEALPDVRLTHLVRALPDAMELAAAGRDVRCGTLAKLTDADDFDVVIALDGLDRLCSVEGPQLDWAESLAVLRRALRPGGTLLLTVENELGVHRLVDRSSATSGRTDGAWRPLGEFDRSRPGSPTRLAGRLAADGLATTWLGAAWPLPEAPTLIATPAVLSAPDGPVGALSAAAAAAAARAYPGRPVLSDPRRLAAAAVRGGLGTEFAPAWVVVAHRAPGPAAGPALPQVLLGDDAPVQEFGRDPDARWVRRTVGAPPAAPPRQNGRVRHDPAALDGPLPPGRLLEELLLAACLGHDLPAVRNLLTGWAAWLSRTDGSCAFATVDNVLVHDGRYALYDPSRATIPPVAPHVAAVRALRRFATLLVTGGYAHPWPHARDVGTLTVVLAGAAGLDADAEAVTAAVALDRELGGSAVAAPPEGGGPAPEPIRPDSWREAAELIRRLSGQLADATGRAEWYADELNRRDAELRRARLEIALFSGSPVHRLARLGVTAARTGVRAARRLQRLPARLRRLTAAKR